MATTLSRRLRIGIDTGGTFTDVVAVDEATGEIFTTKTPSTPGDPSIGVLDGIRKILRLIDRAAPAPAFAPTVAAVSHGTTVATNRTYGSAPTARCSTWPSSGAAAST